MVFMIPQFPKYTNKRIVKKITVKLTGICYMEKYNIINLKIFDFGNSISDKIWNWKAKNKE